MPYDLHLKVISHMRLCMHGISGVLQQFMHHISRDGELFAPLFTLTLFSSNECMLHNLLQLVELMAVCIMSLSLCCFLLQIVPPMAEYFYEDQWCHCNCFDLR